MKMMMIALALASSSAFASTYTLDLDCSQVAGIVQSQGAAVLYTSATDYDRYVKNDSFCDIWDQYADAAYVPTKDSKWCFVGYTCVDKGSNGQ